MHLFCSGGVEAAVSITVCNMSVIIPAIFRVLGVGDPFMREDTVDPNFSTIEMAPVSLTRIELGLSKTHSAAVVTNSDESEGVVGMAASLQQHSINTDGKDDRKHRLVRQASDRSFGDSNAAKVVPLVVGY